MRTISAVDLRNDLEGIVKLLRKGGHQWNSLIAARVVAEMAAFAKSVPKLKNPTPLSRTRSYCAQAITADDPLYAEKVERLHSAKSTRTKSSYGSRQRSPE